MGGSGLPQGGTQELPQGVLGGTPGGAWGVMSVMTLAVSRGVYLFPSYRAGEEGRGKEEETLPKKAPTAASEPPSCNVPIRSCARSF